MSNSSSCQALPQINDDLHQHSSKSGLEPGSRTDVSPLVGAPYGGPTSPRGHPQTIPGAPRRPPAASPLPLLYAAPSTGQSLWSEQGVSVWLRTQAPLLGAHLGPPGSPRCQAASVFWGRVEALLGGPGVSSRGEGCFPEHAGGWGMGGAH